MFNLSYEVMLGSLLAYFMNSSGRHAAAAIDALNEIGASGTASVLERAARRFDLHGDAWYGRQAEIEKSAKLYDVLKPYEDLPNADELSDLTVEFRQAEVRDNMWQSLNEYLKLSVLRLAKNEST